jgi:hypothetical protein
MTGGDVIADLDVGGVKFQKIVGGVAQDAALTNHLYPLVIGGRASAAAPTSVSTDADAVISWHLLNGAQATVLTAAGALIPGDATNGLDVDVTRVIPGTSATHLGKAIDTAVGATDTGVAALAARDDALATLTEADGDWTPLRTNSRGAAWVTADFGNSSGTTAVSVTRPSNTTTYGALDVVGVTGGGTAAISFTSLAPSGARVMVTGVSLRRDATAVISGETNYLLHLYNVTPPSALADNDVFDLGSGDRNAYLGYINVGTPVDLGSTLWVENQGIMKQVQLSGTGLFGYLVTVTGYQPASAAVHVITLHTIVV